ncbi:hypothetical protein [Acinetobacter baumannii]|uniref:hypothetical protein n=1 Tax=Acinetobacter baumannii TaxID=470 RepID=UPI0004F54B80|nr:hypothetical protein [Acinetobacter baumannii]MCE6432709.1 hypothetical protein [Acinetobacter baumannii]MCJ8793830.1 hypothetical protein [Acinetobacter baumannii]MCJ8903875.1 hypothetical protein [Acinetobacter baumannii]MCJ9372664.1 hypothetical protein [Acinetobacter baumannii]MCJ9474392.1 hypothetical protein [Acinetobacter baumannii]
MVTALLIICVLLVVGLMNLKAKVDDLTKTNQYNLDVFNKRFEDIDDAFKNELEARNHLLERIHELEKKAP